MIQPKKLYHDLIEVFDSAKEMYDHILELGAFELFQHIVCTYLFIVVFTIIGIMLLLITICMVMNRNIHVKYQSFIEKSIIFIINGFRYTYLTGLKLNLIYIMFLFYYYFQASSINQLLFQSYVLILVNIGYIMLNNSLPHLLTLTHLNKIKS